MHTFGIFLAAVLFATSCAHADDLADADDWRTGLLLPGFADNTLSGESLRDEPVLLQFWASWCRSCGQLMSDVDVIAERFPSVRYLAVSIDEDAADARRRLDAHPLFPHHKERFYHDPERRLATRFEVATVPTILVIAADGRERLRLRGHVNSSDLNRLVTRLAELDTTGKGSQP